MRFLILTLFFLAPSWADDEAPSAKKVVQVCTVPDNYCSCYWDGTKIQCDLKYNYYNTTLIYAKSSPISGDSCGHFYYKCRLINNNIQLIVHACPEWLKSKQEGGENTYHCVKHGPIVECGITICDISKHKYIDVGKCNNPEWYAIYHDRNQETTLTAVTVSGNLVGAPGADHGSHGFRGPPREIAVEALPMPK